MNKRENFGNYLRRIASPRSHECWPCKVQVPRGCVDQHRAGALHRAKTAQQARVEYAASEGLS